MNNSDKLWSTPVPGEEELLLQHTGLVHSILHRDFSGLQIEYDDALQIGLLALLKAIRTYDSEKGAALPTWATTCIRSELIRTYRHIMAQKRQADRGAISLDAPISDDDDRTLQIPDTNQDLEREAISRAQVAQLRSRLRGRDLEIVEMMLAGRSISEVCEATGLSRHIVEGRLRQMRKIVEEENPVSENSKVNNSLSDMNDFLFAQMKRLGDGSLTGESLKEEVMRSKAMADVATRIIQSGELVLRAHSFRDRQVDTNEKLPRLLDSNE